MGALISRKAGRASYRHVASREGTATWGGAATTAPTIFSIRALSVVGTNIYSRIMRSAVDL